MMILSFHPCFEADHNIICAGREPCQDDLNAIKSADAVILSQGCGKKLYFMARENCRNVFPDFDAKFKYPNKTGQTILFNKINVAHPDTEIYNAVSRFYDKYGTSPGVLPFSFPFVFKFDWGGEGDNVFLIKSFKDLTDILLKAEKYESTGQKGFLIQEYISCGNKSLRAVIINSRIITYWRVRKDSEPFFASTSKDSTIDHHMEPQLQKAAALSLKKFCKKTEINLAGFDFLFSDNKKNKEPIFLEINYFFGRKGLGGSKEYYKILLTEIQKWIDSLKLTHNKPHKKTG